MIYVACIICIVIYCVYDRCRTNQNNKMIELRKHIKELETLLFTCIKRVDSMESKLSDSEKNDDPAADDNTVSDKDKMQAFNPD